MISDPEYKTIVVSAPSGTGKTTLNRRLVAEFDIIELSTSHTTRPAREGEKNGIDYHFISQEEFQNKIIKEEFLEWAEVHGNFYGTSRTEIDRINRLGHTPLLEIDVQGWLLSRPHLSNVTSLFFLPPSLEVLWNRLYARGTDSLATCWLRFQNAYREIEIAEHYQYFIINDNLDSAYQELVDITVRGSDGRNGPERGQELCDALKKEFKNADWIQRLRAQIKGLD